MSKRDKRFQSVKGEKEERAAARLYGSCVSWLLLTPPASHTCSGSKESWGVTPLSRAA